MTDVRLDRERPYLLVVDDNPGARKLIARCLTRAGYDVKEAGTASDAIETMETAPASLILCDVKMPGQDGMWLAAQIRARWPRTAVIMTTSIDDFDTVRESRDLGVFEYFTKPIPADQLLNAVRRATDASEKQGLLEDVVTHQSPQAPSQPQTDPEGEYTLESPVRCAACSRTLMTAKGVRLLRGGGASSPSLHGHRLIVCPHCVAVMGVDVSNC